MDHVDLNMPKISIQESVEAAENVLQERIPERMCEQIRMIDVPKVSSQESVEVVKKLSFGSKFSERMCEQIGVVGVPWIPSQESVESLEIVRHNLFPKGCLNRLGFLQCPRS